MFESRWNFKKEYESGTSLFSRIGESRPDIGERAGNLGLDDLHDPFLITDMKTAVDLILGHIDKNNKIVIHGDYDADGITSSSILYDFLKNMSPAVDWFIPDRFDEGYGIAFSTAEYFIKEGYELVITTDCGITAVNEVGILKKNGVDVVITDHHKVKESIPDANAVLCNFRNDSQYPFRHLSGAGMAFKLVSALSLASGRGDEYRKYTGLAAIGTIADIVPLTGENRVIVKTGLDLLRNVPVPGIDSIISESGILKKQLNETDIGFVIGPRLNAAGRMGDAGIAFELLNTCDIHKADNLAAELSKLNKKRKRVQEENFVIINNELKNKREITEHTVLVVSHKHLHKGVLGIVASKLTDTYGKPAIVMTEKNGICEGSGRSTEGFDLVKALEFSSELLDDFGGHSMAAGLGMKAKNIEELRRRLDIHAIQTGYCMQGDTVDIDTECRLFEISTDSINELDSLGPFGNSNQRPVLAVKDAIISNKRMIGRDNRHMKFRIFEKNGQIECISFYSDLYSHLVSNGCKYDIAFIPETNTYMGITRVQARLVDIKTSVETEILILLTLLKEIRKSNAEIDKMQLFDLLNEMGMHFAALDVLGDRYNLSITKEDVEGVYKILLKGNGSFISHSAKDTASVEILQELEIITLERKSLLAYDNINIRSDRKNSIENSRIYRCLKEWNTKHTTN